jgi:hypothetical protein
MGHDNCKSVGDFEWFSSFVVGPPMTQKTLKVFIVGGGFGGIAAAKALAGAPVEATLIDRRNYHVFQPLLYQVATASLSPADISSPIRTILRGQSNCQVAMVVLSTAVRAPTLCRRPCR